MRPCHALQLAAMACLACGALAACNTVATTEHWARNAIGSPIGHLASLAGTAGSFPERHGGLRREQPLANGHDLYRYPLGPSCDVLFEADGSGIVRGFVADGPGC